MKRFWAIFKKEFRITDRPGTADVTEAAHLAPLLGVNAGLRF